MSGGDAIPEFSKAKSGDGQDVSLTNLSAFAGGPGVKSGAEVAAILVVAAVIIGGIELALRIFHVPQYIMPPPSAIVYALFDEFPLIAPHLGYTLVELFSGFAIGAVVGLVMAAVITQFPFAEKIVAPYILILVTTPMLALVPLLILRFGFGYTPRIIAVALAAGPMVMINAATGFRRVDSAKIALARSYGASTLQIFWKIRAPMALPMILVGLMIGAIFGLLTAVGAEMVGGGFGLGNRLTSYSSMIQMPQFFAVVLILSTLGILIYVLFFLIGKKWASWEA
ncbi:MULTISPECIES: ABC transporter permease [unclassified Mesorhizobium]|uniref:ABC transporter permease n=2 Tax=Mesorhizobium TaxID=68287 RepID=UPI000BB00582|nr:MULTISPECIES: ABC transporter permease [unclassified Mesorhizobium]PBB36379.1 ABC transporter permease [Mesorhizobium sp. WSM3882]RUV07869.1 ABC transporter permease [Mesorhizobium sp. M1A.F.Ca.IN.020.03.2.1]RUV85521.1 ABC transporter permease [Mesorhizobium sp. M1A.F.Ca.IN.020.32.1.1]RUW14877.1 ABC transporter permease [Mesorhizobium sp. M1A.F.Ca.IN.022.05.2.1]RWF82216.1 MAG: ABC transporter permease [Mesorhizobium sp.]